MKQCLKEVYLKQGNGTSCGSPIFPLAAVPFAADEAGSKRRSRLGHDTSLTLNLLKTGQERTTNFAGCHLLLTISYSEV